MVAPCRLNLSLLQLKLEQRESWYREQKYVVGRPTEPKGRPIVLNTRTVRPRPSKGTSNLELGIYRQLDQSDERRVLDCHRLAARLGFNPKPRLKKRPAK